MKPPLVADWGDWPAVSSTAVPERNGDVAAIDVWRNAGLVLRRGQSVDSGRTRGAPSLEVSDELKTGIGA